MDLHAEFEAWYINEWPNGDNKYYLRRNTLHPDKYAENSTQKMWLAYKAAHESGQEKGFAAGLQAAAWNPIETAPKDNKRPLILAILNDDGTVRHIDYDGKWMFVSDGASDHYARSGYDWTSNQGLESPTHWIYQPTLKSQPSDYTANKTKELEELRKDAERFDNLLSQNIVDSNGWLEIKFETGVWADASTDKKAEKEAVVVAIDQAMKQEGS